MTFEEFISDARSLMTVVSLLTFVGIIWWAYSSRRKADFEEAANLPFADEMDIQGAEKQHG